MDVSSIVYLKNAKTETVYAYLNDSVWDPEKKKCVCKRRCIGHVDPVTGEIVANRSSKDRKHPRARSEHICRLFDSVSEKMGLTEVLTLCFPDDWKTLITLAYYIAATDDELTFSKQWTECNKTPSNSTMDPDTINELFRRISNNSISLFFTLWRLHLQPEEVYINTLYFKESCIDHIEYARKMGVDVDPNTGRIRMDLYFTSGNNMPLCYSLSDMATGRQFGDYDVNPASFNKLTSLVDGEGGEQLDPSLIAYAGSNLIARIPADHEFVAELVQKARTSISGPEHYRSYLGMPMFIETFMNHIMGKKYYTHICYDTNKALGELKAFISVVNVCRYEVETENRIEEHEHFYEKYLLVNADEDGEIQTEYNSEAILNHNSTAGYTVYISNYTRNPMSAIVPFIQRNMIQNAFDDMFNEYDSYMLNLSNEGNRLSRIFIQFIAIAIRLEIERIMNVKKLNKTISYKELIEEISNIETIKLPDVKKSVTTELSDTQRLILKAFELFEED